VNGLCLGFEELELDQLRRSQVAQRRLRRSCGGNEFVQGVVISALICATAGLGLNVSARVARTLSMSPPRRSSTDRAKLRSMW
jgi:hypothetical protein